MTDRENPTGEEIPEGADKETLDELMEKDSKSGRTLTRTWYWITSAMGIFMVLFLVFLLVILQLYNKSLILEGINVNWNGLG